MRKLKQLTSIVLAVLMVMAISTTAISASAVQQSDNATTGTITPATELCFGDVNGDKMVNINDSTLIQKYSAMRESIFEDYLVLGDVNSDSRIDILDATCIQKYLAKKSGSGFTGLMYDPENPPTVPTTEPTETTTAVPTTEPTETTTMVPTTEPTETTTIVPTTIVPTTTVVPSTTVQPTTGKYSDAVKEADKKYRAEYADFIKQNNLDDLLKGLMVEKNSGYYGALEFRDMDYGYIWYPNDQNNTTILIGAYYGSSTDVVLPTSVNGYTVDGLLGDGPSNCFCFNGSNDNTGRAITSLTVPDCKKRFLFDDFACFHNPTLETINLGEGVVLNPRAFEGCKKLKNVNLPDGLTSIPEKCFEFCSSLTEINIPDSVTSIKEYSLSDTSLVNVTLSKNVNSAYRCFMDIYTLRNVYVYNKDAEITQDCFSVGSNNNEYLVIHGYKGSTSEELVQKINAFADKYGNDHITFKEL